MSRGQWKLKLSTLRLNRVVDGVRNVRGTLMVLTALQNSGDVSYPGPRRDQWLSEHLDHSFAKKTDGSGLGPVMEVALSKGLDYTSLRQENGGYTAILHTLNTFQHNATPSHSTATGPGVGRGR